MSFKPSSPEESVPTKYLYPHTNRINLLLHTYVTSILLKSKLYSMLSLFPLKKVSEYDQEYHNRKLQINLWYREEEPHNIHKTPGRQQKQSNQLSLSHQDNCKLVLDTK